MNTPPDLRIPRHSIEAEQSLIGGLLLDNTAWSRIADVVVEADFYRDDHRRIFGHIRKIVETGNPADVVTIFESIQRANEIDQTGGLAYLGEIANATPSAANIRRYAEIVHECAVLRRLVAVGDEIAASALNPGERSAATIAAEGMGKVASLAAPKNSSSARLKVVGLHHFMATVLPAREAIMSPWLMTQSLNMIYGWRGVGKTHVSLGIFFAVGTGGAFLGWKVGKARKALLIDGEMPGPALQERLAAIVASANIEPQPGYLSIVTPDLQDGAMPDLATYEGQDAISAIVEQVGAEVIIIDNLSCLVRGAGRENDAESWQSVSEWALLQRQRGRSVVFIHHSGKNGQQRGTSKREDLLDVVISLRRPPDYDPASGACFELHYEKARHLSGEAVNPIEAQLTTDTSGLCTWTWRHVSDSTLDRVVSLAAEGLSQVEIANELELNRSTVSRAWRKAEAEGKLTTKASTKGRNQYAKGRDGE